MSRAWPDAWPGTASLTSAPSSRSVRPPRRGPGRRRPRRGRAWPPPPIPRSRSARWPAWSRRRLTPTGCRGADGRPRARRRLLAVLGLSSALGEHLYRHPEQWGTCATAAASSGPARDAPGPLRAVGAEPTDAEPVAARPAEARTRCGWRTGRAARHRRARPGRARPRSRSCPRSAGELADLAAATLEAALAVARRGAARRRRDQCRLAVIAHGQVRRPRAELRQRRRRVFVAEARAGGPRARGAALTGRAPRWP